MKKGVFFSIVAILVVLFIGSGAYLANYFLEAKAHDDRNNQLIDQKNQAASAATSAPTETTDNTQPSDSQPTEPTEKQVIPEYKVLYEQNSDLVGWIKIDGTKIDYPVMQTSVDNKDFYLDHNFDKESDVRGAIYAREECDFFAPSDNVTLYGHNMRDGSQFAALGSYYDKATWEDNPLIFLDTLYEYHVYKIFAVFKTSANVGEGFTYHRMEDAADEQEFNEFVATCKKLSFYDTGITPVYGDKLICLSTCEYTLDNGRFVVAAVRIS